MHALSLLNPRRIEKLLIIVLTLSLSVAIGAAAFAEITVAPTATGFSIQTRGVTYASVSEAGEGALPATAGRAAPTALSAATAPAYGLTTPEPILAAPTSRPCEGAAQAGRGRGAQLAALAC